MKRKKCVEKEFDRADIVRDVRLALIRHLESQTELDAAHATKRVDEGRLINSFGTEH